MNLRHFSSTIIKFIMITSLPPTKLRGPELLARDAGDGSCPGSRLRSSPVGALAKAPLLAEGRSLRKEALLLALNQLIHPL